MTDGQVIPWKSLSIGEFLKYRDILRAGVYAPSVIEAEIFCQCVLDPVIISHIEDQKAGTITTVVTAILNASGPISLDDFNNRLNSNRRKAKEPLNQAVAIICQAFPGYTPDILEKLDCEALMFRLAQAEDRLLAMGFLSEPIVFEGTEQPKKKKPKIDKEALKKIYESQGITEGVSRSPQKDFKLKADTKNPKKMNRPGKFTEEITPRNSNKVKDGKVIITNAQMAERFATGKDMEDLCLMEAEMAKDVALIYPDYAKQMTTGKTVEIKTVEERVNDAKIRADERRKALQARKK